MNKKCRYVLCKGKMQHFYKKCCIFLCCKNMEIIGNNCEISLKTRKELVFDKIQCYNKKRITKIAIVSVIEYNESTSN